MLFNRNFGDLVTLTRATAGWSYSAGGILVQSAASVPRLDYNPLTLAALGLLGEGQSTNLVSYSENYFGSGWGQGSGWIVATNAGSTPAGTANATSIVEDTTTVSRSIQNSQTLTAGASYTLTTYVKRLSGTRYFGMNIAGGAPGATFDLTGVTAASQAGSQTNVAASITPVGNGWFRCSLSFTNSQNLTGTSARLTISSTVGSSQLSYLGDGTSGFYVWGTQFESGLSATSYIPTAGAQVTRAPDSLILANTASWFNSTAGTFVIAHDAPSGRVLLGSGAATILASTGAGKTSIAYDGSGSSVVVNGGSSTAGGVLSFGASLQLLGSSAAYANAHCSSFKYYPRKLSIAEQQGATT